MCLNMYRDYNYTFIFVSKGIVNCANEAYGRLPDDQAITRHFDKDYENSVRLFVPEFKSLKTFQIFKNVAVKIRLYFSLN